ncbi:MAG: chromosome partitioning protein [Oleispira sp.]
MNALGVPADKLMAHHLPQEIADIKEDHNPSMDIDGIIANQLMANANIPK